MAQPPTIQTRDFRPTALDTLKAVAEQGEWASVTRYNLPYAELHPAGTAERLHRLEAQMQPEPRKSDEPLEMTTEEYERLERDGLGGYLAANALAQAHFDVSAARKALLEALLKLETRSS